MGPGGVGPGDATHAHQPPSTCTPAKRAGSSDAACRHGLIWDHTVFHVVTELSSQASDGGSFEAQLSDRPADRPHTQTRPRCAHRVVLLDKGRDLAGVFAAYPSPYCATGTLPGPRPKARRSPPPPRARGLERFSPQSGHPASWLHDSTSSIRASGVRATLIALQTDEQITPITTIKRHTAAGRARHHPRSCEDRGGRSPLIIKDLDLYPQPPLNTRSPTLNSEEPVFSMCIFKG